MNPVNFLLSGSLPFHTQSLWRDEKHQQPKKVMKRSSQSDVEHPDFLWQGQDVGALNPLSVFEFIVM